jgi:hypothetical protein
MSDIKTKIASPITASYIIKKVTDLMPACQGGWQTMNGTVSLTRMENEPLADEKTYVVTWKTVVTLNPTSDPELDESWAVLTARNTMRDLVNDPESQDNYFEVESIGNSPATRTYVRLTDAIDHYGTENFAARMEAKYGITDPK